MRLKVFWIFTFLSLASVSSFVDAVGGLESIYENKEGKDFEDYASPQLIGKGSAGKGQSSNSIYDLSPFKNVAVISKKFLPKTSRMELSLQGSWLLNQHFHAAIGVNPSISWYFTERWGIEVSHTELFAYDRALTEALDNQTIKTGSSLGRRYSVAAIKWSPFYGKAAFFEKNITYFDFFFKVGGGVTGSSVVIFDENDKITEEDNSAPTLHLGAGQNFALTRSLAVRWDLNMNIYWPQFPSSTEKKVRQDILLMLGISYFFPGAH